MIRLVRRLFITAVILGGLFIGANVFVTRQAEERVASAIEKNFKIDDVTVDITDFPLLVHLFNGKLDEVIISASDTTIAGFGFDSLGVTLADLEIAGGLLGSGKLAVSVGHGTMRAATTQDAINAYLQQRRERATVTLGEGTATVRATRQIAGADRRLVATGRFVLVKGKQILRFIPSRVTVDGETPPRALQAEAKRKAALEVKIPRLPGEIKADTIEVRPGVLAVSADFRDTELSIAG